MSPKDADGLANSEDPDQTAPLGTVCPDLSVRKLWIITVNNYFDKTEEILHLFINNFTS